jgi:hypothetical protein
VPKASIDAIPVRENVPESIIRDGKIDAVARAKASIIGGASAVVSESVTVPA